MSAIARVLRYVWALPNTVLGILLGLLSFRLPRVEDGVLLFEGSPRGFLWILSRMRRQAVTFGHAVLTAERYAGSLRRHELAHVRQYEMLGPAYIPAYLAVWLVRGYRRHPFELAATRAERSGHSGRGEGGRTPRNRSGAGERPARPAGPP